MASHLFISLFCALLFVSAADKTDLTRIKRESTKCFEDLGCFSTGGDFYHSTYRPFNLLPQDREKIGVEFNLYTRKNSKESYKLRAKNENNIRKSPFDPQQDTKIIIHGWIDNQLFGAWMGKMKDAFLLNENVNVIIVDWKGGNSLPYTQATANTRLVGAELALLINYITDLLAYSPLKVHIAGHSLGAHIAGYAGERIKGLGRITGMDPAEPYFQHMPPSVRIDPTDADFVDVIHTDSLSIFQFGLGMSQLVGHVDFFPNNGFQQPGCNRDRFTSIISEGLFEGIRRFVACDHQRAVDFMTESIGKSHCPFVSVSCLDWESYTQGRCSDCGPSGERCSPMGFHADTYREVYKKAANSTRKQLKFFTKTTDKLPFCLFHYQIAIKLENCKECKDDNGKLQVKLTGNESSVTIQLDDNKSHQLHHGSVYTFLATTSKKIGSIKNVVFSWTSTKFSILRKPSIYVKSIKIVPLSIVDHNERKTAIRNYCQNPVLPIKSGESSTFNQLC